MNILYNYVTSLSCIYFWDWLFTGANSRIVFTFPSIWLSMKTDNVRGDFFGPVSRIDSFFNSTMDEKLLGISWAYYNVFGAGLSSLLLRERERKRERAQNLYSRDMKLNVWRISSLGNTLLWFLPALELAILLFIHTWKLALNW